VPVYKIVSNIVNLELVTAMKIVEQEMFFDRIKKVDIEYPH
jgi:hypothetical protein